MSSGAEGIRKCVPFEKELLDTAWRQIEDQIRLNG